MVCRTPVPRRSVAAGGGGAKFVGRARGAHGFHLPFTMSLTKFWSEKTSRTYSRCVVAIVWSYITVCLSTLVWCLLVVGQTKLCQQDKGLRLASNGRRKTKDTFIT